ncbi:MAG: tRNA epoxyqueuosine(34) reductase QueG, partial [Candidatus Binataceae bacterium]
LAGFAPLHRLDDRAGFLAQWIAQGRAAEMAWLARDPDRRLDPRTLDPRLRSVISLAHPYAPPRPPDLDWRAELRGRIASYAIGLDYHDTVLAKARAVAQTIERHAPAAVLRLYVDTGPVLEREWAAQARLGWFGRNTNLINRYQGSYFFLAEILTDLEFESSAEPYRDHCGSCRQCLDLCPTGALAGGYLLEPRVCISYLTIEHRGPIPPALRPKLGNWIFGCDICQEVCPWNDDRAAAEPACDALMPSLSGLMAIDAEGFNRRFRGSAIKRTKRRGLLRNAAIALGNSGNPAAVPILARVLNDESEPLVRSHAAWALGRLGGIEAVRILDRANGREPDSAVKQEIGDALSSSNG